MPELPEVETIRRDLNKLVVGRKIVSVEIVLDKPLRGYPAGRFIERLTGRTVTGVGRRAKILILELDTGDKVLVHLKMSGRLLYVSNDAPVAKHTHVIFGFDDGRELRFVDMRKFGYVKLVEGGRLEEVDELKGLGPEPLAHDFYVADFARLIGSKAASRRPLKAFLIDQSFIAGIGNLYADEILHAAKILPDRSMSSLSRKDMNRVFQAMRRILQDAIEARGTSFDLYVDAHGEQGGYVKELQVYGRADEPCFACGTPLSKVRLAGRGTSYCAGCQR